jgi:hypothetical protein
MHTATPYNPSLPLATLRCPRGSDARSDGWPAMPLGPWDGPWERVGSPGSDGEQQRAGIEHAKQKDDRAYLGRKPSYTRDQFNKVRDLLARCGVGIAQVAKETGLTRQTVYRIKDDPAGSEAALVAWRM